MLPGLLGIILLEFAVMLALALFLAVVVAIVAVVRRTK
jgi:hypothetical protein